MKPECRPATAEDVAAFYDPPPERTMRALCWMIDGERMALVGIMYPGGKAHPTLISKIRPEARRYRIGIARHARESVEALADLPLMAVSDREEPGSARFLAWLGFRFVHGSPIGDVYRYERTRRLTA